MNMLFGTLIFYFRNKALEFKQCYQNLKQNMMSVPLHSNVHTNLRELALVFHFLLVPILGNNSIKKCKLFEHT